MFTYGLTIDMLASPGSKSLQYLSRTAGALMSAFISTQTQADLVSTAGGYAIGISASKVIDEIIANARQPPSRAGDATRQHRNMRCLGGFAIARVTKHLM